MDVNWDEQYPGARQELPSDMLNLLSHIGQVCFSAEGKGFHSFLCLVYFEVTSNIVFRDPNPL